MENKNNNLIIILVAVILISIATGIIANFGKPKDISSYTTTTNITQTTTIETTTSTTTTTKKTTKKVINRNIEQKSGYKITHYGPDCKGCSGITASGFNAKKSIYYNDKEYGTVRVVAMGRSIPLYSIIRINDYADGNFIAIVLDRGVGNGVIDVLVENERKATQLGIKKNASVDILRRGK